MATILLPATLPGKRAEEMPAIRAGKSSLLVAGSGRCLWDDIANLGQFDGDVMAVSYAGLFFETLPQHWFSLDPILFQFMLPLRVGAVITPEGIRCQRIETHADRPALGVLHAWPQSVIQGGGGTSSLAAVRVGLAMGYERVILAGVPLDGSGHFYDPPSMTAPPDYSPESSYWEAAVPQFNGRVRSLSGVTREILGAP